MDQSGQWLIGLAALLVAASAGYVSNTAKTLADAVVEQAKARKAQATVEAWFQLRPALEPPEFADKAEATCAVSSPQVLPQLASLDAYAACVNSDLYDLATFDRVLGAWFLEHCRRWERHVEAARRGEAHPPYEDLVALQELVQRLRT
jgi:hypothetical protein